MLAALAGVASAWLPSVFSLSAIALLSVTLHYGLPLLTSTPAASASASATTSVAAFVELVLHMLLPSSAPRQLHWLNALLGVVTCTQLIIDDCCMWLFSSVLCHFVLSNR